MSSSNIEVNYEALEQVMQQLQAQMQSFDSYYQRLKSKVEQLEDGWMGEGATAFFEEMRGDVLPRFKRLTDAFGTSAAAVYNIIDIMETAEEEAAGVFNREGGVVGGRVIRGGIAFGSGSVSVNPDSDSPFRDYPRGTISGSRMDYYAGLRSGEMSPEDVRRYLEEDPFKNPRFGFDAKANLYDASVTGRAALFDSYLSGDFGSARLSGVGIEGTAGLEVGIDKDGLGVTGQANFEAYLAKLEGNTSIFGADVDGSLTYQSLEAYAEGGLSIGKDGVTGNMNIGAGYYLAKGEANVQIGGFEATVQGYLGATAEMQNEVKLNPFTGDVYAKSEGEVFVGGRVQGRAEYGFLDGIFNVGVEGEVNYGAGAGYVAEVGVKDGVFRADLGGFISTGLGGGGRVTVEVDVERIVENVGDEVTEYAEAGVDWMVDKGKDLFGFLR